MTNRERARVAERAMDEFTCQVYAEPYRVLCSVDRETALADLICDLMHFAAREDFDFDRALIRAQYHFDHESRFDWDEEVPA